jgi:hypothetical protein
MRFLLEEQKMQIRRALMQLLVSRDHIIRDLASNVIPKVVYADWPNDWPGFLAELSQVIDHTDDVAEIIAALKILRGDMLRGEAHQRVYFRDVDR